MKLILYFMWQRHMVTPAHVQLMVLAEMRLVQWMTLHNILVYFIGDVVCWLFMWMIYHLALSFCCSTTNLSSQTLAKWSYQVHWYGRWSNTTLQPYLNIRWNWDRILQWDNLALERLHGHNSCLLFVSSKLHRMDASKQLLEVCLDDAGVGGLSKDLQEIVVPNEVEAREDGALLLCVQSDNW